MRMVDIIVKKKENNEEQEHVKRFASLNLIVFH